MNIVIIGGGFTGIELAKRLIDEKNQVTLIDNDEETVRHASNRLDCTVMQADGNNLQTLEEAGIAKADAMVAVTSSDEINMITCSLVDAVYPDLLKIARVRNYAYYINTAAAAKHHAETFTGKHRPLYGIDYMIHPDIEAAEAIVSAVEHGAVSDVLSFEDSKYELVRLQVEKNSKFAGLPLKDLRQLIQFKCIIVFVEDENGSSLPSGNTIIQEGNFIGVLIENENLSKVLQLCGTKIDSLRRIGLVGAGRIGTIIADRLIEKRKASPLMRLFGLTKKNVAQNFVIVDSDENICKQMSEKFPDAQVFCGDITDDTFIQEEQLNKLDLLICTTHNHEMNMVVSAYLESLGVGKSIALVSHSAFVDIAVKLGVDVSIPLRDTVVDSIMSHLRGKSVTGLHTISNGEFEIVECNLSSNSYFRNKMLKDIASPGQYLLLLVKKSGSDHFEIPGGNTVLTTGDHLILIEKTGDRKTLEKFSGKK